VEWLSPRGGHFLYGLLGATAQPTKGTDIELQVILGRRGSSPYRSLLASSLDRLHLGLPCQYAQAVLESAVTTLGNCPLPASTIRFDEAVYGEIGSSEFVFQRLAKVIIELLGADISHDHFVLRETITGILLS